MNTGSTKLLCLVSHPASDAFAHLTTVIGRFACCSEAVSPFLLPQLAVSWHSLVPVNAPPPHRWHLVGRMTAICDSYQLTISRSVTPSSYNKLSHLDATLFLSHMTRSFSQVTYDS